MSYQPRQRPPASPAVWAAVAVAVVIVVAFLATASGVLEWNLTSRAAPDEVLGESEVPPPVETTAVSEPSTTTTEAPTTTTTSVPPSWKDVAAGAGPSVVRVETVSCGARGAGTGFLVGPDVVLTAAHVVEGAQLVAVIGDERSTTARVVGADVDEDLALLRLADGLNEAPLVLSSASAAVGEEVAAVGYPRGTQRVSTVGHVTALDESSYVRTVDFVLSGLLRHDASINPGNSGGPLLGLDGEVKGINVANDPATSGSGFAVPAAEADALVRAWLAAPAPIEPDECASSISSAHTFVSVRVPHRDAMDLAASLQVWVDGVNGGDYETAWNQLSPAYKQLLPFEDFEAGFRTSILLAPELWRVEEDGPDVRTAQVTFFSLQEGSEGPDGQHCSFWRNQYEFVWLDDGWKLDRSQRLDQPEAC